IAGQDHATANATSEKRLESKVRWGCDHLDRPAGVEIEEVRLKTDQARSGSARKRDAEVSGRIDRGAVKRPRFEPVSRRQNLDVLVERSVLGDDHPTFDPDGVAQLAVALGDR